MRNAVHKRDKNDANDPLTKADLAELKKYEQKLLESYRLLIPSRSKLHLVGAREAVKVLDKFKAVSDDFFTKANIDNPTCTEEFLDGMKIKITAARHNFYDSMQVAYGS